MVFNAMHTQPYKQCCHNLQHVHIKYFIYLLGAIGISGVNRYNDTLLYIGLIDFIFAVLFLAGWYSCQLEVDDVTEFARDIPTQ